MNASQLIAMVPRRIRRPMGNARRWLRALPVRTGRQKERLLATGQLTATQRELLTRVDSKICYAAGMYAGDGNHYFKVGLSAIEWVGRALSQSGPEPIGTMRTSPCGY